MRKIWFDAQAIDKVKRKKKVHKNLVANRFRNQHLNAVQNAGGRPRQHLQHLTAWLFHVFEAAVSMRFLQKRSKFGKVRRTGSIVHQRSPLPKCLCSSDRRNGRLRPLLLPFPAERKRMGPRGLSACLTFYFH